MDQIRIFPSFRGFRVMAIVPPKATGFQGTRSKERDRRLLQQRRRRLLDRIAPQPADFFGRATVDTDGTLVATDAACKGGVDIAYDGTWGYHPLLVTLANTGEPLFLANRPGNRPSHEGAHTYIDEAIAWCQRAGFRRIALRGDTDFSQTAHLDRWDALDGVRFLFGMGNNEALVARAEGLPAEAYSFLERPPKYAIKTAPRERPEHVKAEVVRRRG